MFGLIYFVAAVLGVTAYFRVQGQRKQLQELRDDLHRQKMETYRIQGELTALKEGYARHRAAAESAASPPPKLPTGAAKEDRLSDASPSAWVSAEKSGEALIARSGTDLRVSSAPVAPAASPAEKPAPLPATPPAPPMPVQEGNDTPTQPDAALSPPASPTLSEERLAPVVRRETVVMASPSATPGIHDGGGKNAVDWEVAIGKRWLTWGGVLLLAIGTGFLIKYAYDQDWIGPWTQVAMGVAVGVCLCVLGDWQIRVRDMRPLGQGVMALGLALVYLACFGAYAVFKLEPVSQTTALMLLTLTSAAGVWLSSRHRAMAISILSAIGAYLAPILVATGRPPPVNGLLTYTLLVNLGVIAVAVCRTWPALPLLAFAGTVAHVWGWHHSFYHPEQAVLVAAWAAAFHFTFLILPALPLLRGQAQTPWQWLLPVANAALGSYVVWGHLGGSHELALLLVLLGMAAVHIAIGGWNRDAPENRGLKGVYSLLGLALLTLSPLAWFGVGAGLVCWLLLGLALLELGMRFRFPVYCAFAYINCIIAAFWAILKLWTLTNDLTPLAQFLYAGFAPIEQAHINGYGSAPDAFLATLFTVGRFWTRLVVPAAFALCVVILHRWRDRSPDGHRFLRTVFSLGAVLFALAFITNDITPWTFLRHGWEDGKYRLACLTMPLWCLGALGVAFAGWRWRDRAVGGAAYAFLLPMLFVGSILFFHNRLPQTPIANIAFAVKVFFAVAALLVSWMLGGEGRYLRTGIASYALVAVLHSEAWCLGGRTGWYSGSLVWSAAAIAYMLIGWRLNKAALSRCMWLPWAFGLALALLALFDNMTILPFRPFLNGNFLACVVSAAVLFIRSGVAARGRYWMMTAGGWLLLAVIHGECLAWAEHISVYWRNNRIYQFWWRPAVTWSLGSLVFAAAFRWKRRREMGIGALVAMAAASVCIGTASLFRFEMVLPPPAFVNSVYGTAVMLFLAILVAASGSARLRFPLIVVAGYFLLLASSVEISYYYKARFDAADLAARSARFALLWAGGGAAFLVAAVRCRSGMLFKAALPALLFAVGAAAWQYAIDRFGGDRLLFLNLRFATSFLVLGVFFAACRVLTAYSGEGGTNAFLALSRRLAPALYAVLAVLGLVLATAECSWWCLAGRESLVEARRMAQMSVSIVWSVYSIMLLAIGFASRIRAWRLAGLALFGMTCLKLVIVDLSHLKQQIHRVFAFMAVGLLLMGASYLYHKMEKRIQERDDRNDGRDGRETGVDP